MTKNFVFERFSRKISSISEIVITFGNLCGIFGRSIVSVGSNFSSLSSFTLEPKQSYRFVVFVFHKKRLPCGSLLKTGMEGLEPPKWLDQNQLPYHLATSH